MPVCGLFSPHRNPERCFLPRNDSRYEFHILPDINRREDKDRLRFCLSNDFISYSLSKNVILWADIKMHESTHLPKKKLFEINKIKQWLKCKIK